MDGDLVAAALEILAQQVGERLVRELCLLQTADVGLSFVQPWQQPG
jgi:hypothetical protein